MKHTEDVDELARRFAEWGRVGKNMAPSWKGAHISVPLVGREGQRIGSMLPGTGLYLDCDLSRLGITKPIPNVHERSFLQRGLELFADDRGAISTFAQIRRNIQAGLGQTVSALRTVATDILTGQYAEFFGVATDLQAGTTQSYTAIPGGQVYDTSSASVINAAMINPIGSNTTYLCSFGFNLALAGQTNPACYTLLWLSDLLVAAGSIPTDTVSTSTVNTVALPRYTNGIGVNACFLMTTGASTGGLPITVVYTNQAGFTQTTSFFTASDAGPSQPMIGDPNDESWIVPFMPLFTGDYGVMEIQSFTMGSADTSGNRCAVQLQYPLIMLAATGAADDYFEYDFTTTVTGFIQMQASSNGHLGAITVMGCANGQVGSGQAHLMTFVTVQG